MSKVAKSFLCCFILVALFALVFSVTYKEDASISYAEKSYYDPDVTVNHLLEGIGEYDYRINTANEFMYFIHTLAIGETYEGKKIQLTSDIDINNFISTTFEEDTGLIKVVTLGGTYYIGTEVSGKEGGNEQFDVGGPSSLANRVYRFDDTEKEYISYPENGSPLYICGTSSFNNAAFAGVFDGGNYTISGLYIPYAYSLFPLLDENGAGATLRNVKLQGVAVGSGFVSNVTGTAQLTDYVLVDNVEVVSDNNNNSYAVNCGFIKYASNTILNNCTNNATVFTHTLGSAIVEEAFNTILVNTINYGDVTAHGYWNTNAIGGLVATTRIETYETYPEAPRVKIYNCANMGNISVPFGTHIGGIIGNNPYCDIINCFNGGTITIGEIDFDEDALGIGAICGGNPWLVEDVTTAYHNYALKDSYKVDNKPYLGPSLSNNENYTFDTINSSLFDGIQEEKYLEFNGEFYIINGLSIGEILNAGALDTFTNYSNTYPLNKWQVSLNKLKFNGDKITVGRPDPYSYIITYHNQTATVVDQLYLDGAKTINVSGMDCFTQYEEIDDEDVFTNKFTFGNKINDDITLYTKANGKSSLIVYDLNGGAYKNEEDIYEVPSLVFGDPIEIEDDSKIYKNFYTFREWNTQADGKGFIYSGLEQITFSGELTLYAIWTPNEYDITFINTLNKSETYTAYGVAPDEDGFLQLNSDYYLYEDGLLDSPAPFKTKHTTKDWAIVGWSTKEDPTQEGANVFNSFSDYFLDINKFTDMSCVNDEFLTINLYAVFGMKHFGVIYYIYDENKGEYIDVNGDNTVCVEKGGAIAKGDDPMFVGHEYKGHDFFGWTDTDLNYNTFDPDNDSLFSNTLTYNGNSDSYVNLFAVYTSKKYNISYPNYEGNNLDYLDKEYEYVIGALILPGVRDYYQFEGWYLTSDFKDGTKVQDGLLEKETYEADITLYAKWIPLEYNIIYKDKDGVVIHPDGYPTTYTYGTKVDLLPLEDKMGYEFNWYATKSFVKGNTIDKIAVGTYDDVTVFGAYTPNIKEIGTNKYLAISLKENDTKGEGIDLKSMFELAKAEESGLEAKIGDLIITFDKAAVSQIGGLDAKLKAEIKYPNTPGTSFVIELSLDGAIFNQGSATISYPFTDPIPEGKMVKVFYLKSDTEKIDMNATIVNSYVNFTTDHFSTFAVCIVDAPLSPQGNGDGAANGNNLSIGAIAGIAVGAVVVVVVIVFVLLFFSKKKKVTEDFSDEDLALQEEYRKQLEEEEKQYNEFMERRKSSPDYEEPTEAVLSEPETIEDLINRILGEEDNQDEDISK